jgi:tRNA(fMet)-specific endonuclease VapC
MLDTNTISYLIKAHRKVAEHVTAVPMASLCVSAITKGELLFGLARRPEAKRLHIAVRELLRRIDVLPWDGVIAERYGVVRADMQCKGKILAPLDLLIAVHAMGAGATLVTNDRAFGQLIDLSIEDWTE